MSSPHHIVILGGGITGLASAYFARQRFPTSLISVIEKSNRLGGWIRSEKVKSTLVSEPSSFQDSNFVIESGPRTLRPKGFPGALTLHLVPEQLLIPTYFYHL
jgi:oxygen-dependent protoporphyrinogen oxidase